MSHTTTSTVVNAFLTFSGAAGLIAAAFVETPVIVPAAAAAALTGGVGREIYARRQGVQAQLPEQDAAEANNEGASSEATGLIQDASTREGVDEPLPDQARGAAAGAGEMRLSMQERFVKLKEAAEEVAKKEVPEEAIEAEQDEIEDLTQKLHAALSEAALSLSEEGIANVRNLLAAIENITKAANERLKHRMGSFLREVESIFCNGEGTEEHKAAHVEAKKKVTSHIEGRLTAKAMENAEAELNEYKETMEDINDRIERSWNTVVHKSQQPRLTLEDRRQRRSNAILAIKEDILTKARDAIGNFPLSTKLGREGCVAHGPSYHVERDKAAEVRALLREMEGEVLVDGIRCHIVPKGDRYTYDLTGQSNYAPRYIVGHNPKRR